MKTVLGIKKSLVMGGLLVQLNVLPFGLSVMKNVVCFYFRFLETQEGCLTTSIHIRIHNITSSSRSPAIHLQKWAHRSPMSLAHLIHAHLQWASRNTLLGHHAHHGSRRAHPSGSNRSKIQALLLSSLWPWWRIASSLTSSWSDSWQRKGLVPETDAMLLEEQQDHRLIIFAMCLSSKCDL